MLPDQRRHAPVNDPDDDDDDSPSTGQVHRSLYARWMMEREQGGTVAGHPDPHGE
jgi:hypothetical protein